MNSISLAVLPSPPDVTQLDETALVTAARRDPAAFAQLYRAYLRPVYSYALAHIGNCDEAQDITSQTFLAALEGIDHFRGDSRFSTWLFGIAKNKCADHFRKRRSGDRELGMDTVAEEQAQDAPLDDLIEQSTRFEELAHQARCLPADQAEALTLRIFGGLSAAEVGQVMGRSEAAVKMLVHRAVGELRKRLRNWGEAA